MSSGKAEQREMVDEAVGTVCGYLWPFIMQGFFFFFLFRFYHQKQSLFKF